jgi:hypothetical protein
MAAPGQAVGVQLSVNTDSPTLMEQLHHDVPLPETSTSMTTAEAPVGLAQRTAAPAQAEADCAPRPPPTRLTGDDETWLAAARGKKLLDQSTIVMAVAARDDGGAPRVVQCYPLRLADHALRTGGEPTLPFCSASFACGGAA